MLLLLLPLAALRSAAWAATALGLYAAECTLEALEDLGRCLPFTRDACSSSYLASDASSSWRYGTPVPVAGAPLLLPSLPSLLAFLSTNGAPKCVDLRPFAPGRFMQRAAGGRGRRRGAEPVGEQW